jgi:hypothetical protein
MDSHGLDGAGGNILPLDLDAVGMDGKKLGRDIM